MTPVVISTAVMLGGSMLTIDEGERTVDAVELLRLTILTLIFERYSPSS